MAKIKRLNNRKIRFTDRSGEEQAYFNWLSEIGTEAWLLADAEGWTVPEFSGAAGLHNSTVYRFLLGETRFPQARTIWRMARAVGMRLALVQIKQVRKRKTA